MNLPPLPSLRTVALVCLVASAGPALADEATLTIKGNVLAGTCALEIPEVVLADLRAADVTPGDLGMQAGTIKVRNCIAVKQVNLKFTGATAEGDADHWKNTAPAAEAAQGMSIVLKDGEKFEDILKSGDGRSFAPAADAGSYPFKAGYYHAEGDAFTSGAVAASITVNADYN